MKVNARVPDITFFMIVTEPSVPIADYCIQSYRKLKKCSFSYELVVYGNCLSPATKQKYFGKWGQLRYVHLMDNDEYVSADYPQPGKPIVTPEGIIRFLGGPFEYAGTVWTRELPLMQSPFIATVDSDFEIFSKDFIEEAYEMLLGNSTLAGVATNYSPDNPAFYNPYWETTIFLHERWHTWFCLYRRECLQGPTSHHMYVHRDKNEGELKVYDDAGYLQAELMRHGWHFAVLPPETGGMYLHYVAFSNNTKLNLTNIRSYHRYRVWMHRGLFPNLGFKGARGRLNRWWSYLIHELYVRRFGGVNQSREKMNFMNGSPKDVIPKISKEMSAKYLKS